MMMLKKSLFGSLFAATVVLSQQVQAIDLSKDWHLNGFIAQNAVYTDGNNFFGNTQHDLSTDFYETGLVLNGNITPALRFSTQLLARKAGENDDGAPSFDYTFFSYDIVDNMNWNTGLRIGRIPSQVGFYNATRDVPFTRPSILLPQSIYGETVRNTRFAHDGVQWYGEWRGEDLNRLIWHIDYYKPLTDSMEIDDIFSAPLPGTIDGEWSWMTQLIYEWGAGVGRVGITFDMVNYTYGFSGNEFFNYASNYNLNLNLNSVHIAALVRSIDAVPESLLDLIIEQLGKTETVSFSELVATAEPLTEVLGIDLVSETTKFIDQSDTKGEADTPTVLLSAEYNFEIVSFSAEYMRRDIRTSDFDFGLIDVNHTMEQEAYFVQAVFHIAPNWDLLFRHDRFYYDRNDRSGLGLNKRLSGIPAYRAYAFDSTVGLSWHINSSWLTRLELHNLEGTAWLPIHDNPNSQETEKYWNMLALQVAFRF